MARKRGKMALYEVMSKARARSDYGRTVEPLQPKKKPEQVPVVPVAEEEIEAPEPEVSVNWRKKPRIVQYNLGRIEFSIPYQLAITAGLAIFLLLLIAFRFGQFSNRVNREPAPADSGNSNSSRASGPTGLAHTEVSRMAAAGNMNTPPVDSGPAPVTPAASAGKNVIVLVQHSARSHLEPAMEYFNKNNIPAEILKIGDTYFLITKERFSYDPANPGTKGSEIIRKIKEIGKDYKAPQGSDNFAPRYFSDAYGKNIEN